MHSDLFMSKPIDVKETLTFIVLIEFNLCNEHSGTDTDSCNLCQFREVKNDDCIIHNDFLSAAGIMRNLQSVDLIKTCNWEFCLDLPQLF